MEHFPLQFLQREYRRPQTFVTRLHKQLKMRFGGSVSSLLFLYLILLAFFWFQLNKKKFWVVKYLYRCSSPYYPQKQNNQLKKRKSDTIRSGISFRDTHQKSLKFDDLDRKNSFVHILTNSKKNIVVGGRFFDFSHAQKYLMHKTNICLSNFDYLLIINFNIYLLTQLYIN